MTRALAVLAVLPDYRRFFVSEVWNLAAEERIELTIIAGDVHLDPTVTSARFDGVQYVRNVAILGRRILWQRRIARLAWREYDVLVADLNPRSLTAWWFLIVARLRRKRVLLWGHVNPRKGRDASTSSLRRFMRRLAEGLITYTWTDAEQVREDDGHMPVWIAANGLFRREDIELAPGEDSSRYRILCVGRLERSKKPGLAIDAFAKSMPILPESVRLTFVGRGSERAALEARCAELGIAARVDFEGHVTDRDSLVKLYGESLVSLSPGYVGLSLTQSLGFGVPMIVADEEPHAPEVELLLPTTGVSFRANDPESLAAEIVAVVCGRIRFDRAHLVSLVRERYSATAMAEGFIDAILARETLPVSSHPGERP